MQSSVRIFAAEAVGTAFLVLGGCGTAVLATGAFGENSVGILGVALAFGLSLLAMAYAIGNITGCHINPAVTLGLWALGKVKSAQVPVYIVAQLVGAALGGAIIWVIANGSGNFDATPANFATNGWGAGSPGGFNFTAMAVTEVVMTALLVFVVASTTHRKFSTAAGGLTVGLTLTLIHLISIPVDNTSVNPARSFGVALFAGGEALNQLWAFIVFPILGAAIGALIWKLVDDGGREEVPLADA